MDMIKKGGVLLGTEKVIKYSRQREAIVKFLEERKDHPTAEVIYENVRMEYPNISLGTVYRNLKLLEELGMVKRVTSLNNVERYDDHDGTI